MKTFIYILLALASILMVYNGTKIDFGQPLAGDSQVAVISVLACACAILLLVILIISKRIVEKAG